MATLNWRDWFTKTIIEEKVIVKYDPYYFTPSAQEYRDEIKHLKMLLKQAEEARKEAEKAALKNLYPDEYTLQGIKAIRILNRLKMDMDTWTAS